MADLNTREWQPNKGAQLFMSIAGLVLSVIGVILYSLAWQSPGRSGSFALSGSQVWIALAATTGLTLALIVLHEAIHGLVIAAFGAKATFGVTMIGKTIPAFYCTSPGHRFTKSRFLAVALAPMVLLGGACFLLVAFAPLGGWLVLAAALHLGGCIGDVVLAWVAARQPRGTLVEDMKAGVRFHGPVA